MVLSINGMDTERLVYEGCDLVLNDGVVCGLGRIAQGACNLRNKEFGRRNRVKHCCRPVGRGRAMFCLSAITTLGAFEAWDEAGNQLLGMSALELATLTGGRYLPAHIEERAPAGKWHLIVENSGNSSYNRKK